MGWVIFPAAFVLDALFGDPRRLPHPVIYMGRAISGLEPVFRRWCRPQVTAGALFALCLIAATWMISWVMVRLALSIHPVVGGGVQAVMLYYCFSVKSLVQAARQVARPLAAKDLATARSRVAMIVGRDTRSLDVAGVTRAATETVAENFVDGFLSPLFWALVAGVPGAMAYKMINTLDSMVGYRNDTYLFFGRASARIDDVANFVPARLAVGVIAAAACLLPGMQGRRALMTGIRDGRQHKSPNAGFSEAAFAGALGIRMGGPSVYHGKTVTKPFIGSRFPDPEINDIERACRLLRLSSVIALGTSWIVAAIVSWPG